MKKVFSVVLIAVFLSVASVAFATTIDDDMKFTGTTNFTGALQVNGTAVTATAAELNSLADGLKIIATIAMINADYTLSATEALADILNVTGSPSAFSIIAPTISTSGVSRFYTVRNAGADSQNVTLKKTAGTGVAVATGKTARVFWSGSDYVRETADATH